MGNYANSAFSLMFGWMRTAARWIWRLATGEQGRALMDFLGRHWLTVAILLCLLGGVVDFIVYLVRWQPYEVWRSFFRRAAQRGRSRKEKEQQEPADERESAPAQGDAPQMAAEPAAPDMQALQPGAEQLVQRQTMQEQDAAPQTMQPQTVQEDAAQDTAEEQPQGRHRRAERYRRRITLPSFFTEDEMEPDYGHYRPAMPAGDKREAFNEPYYPPQWQNPENGPDAARPQQGGTP